MPVFFRRLDAAAGARSCKGARREKNLMAERKKKAERSEGRGDKCTRRERGEERARKRVNVRKSEYRGRGDERRKERKRLVDRALNSVTCSVSPRSSTSSEAHCVSFYFPFSNSLSLSPSGRLSRSPASSSAYSSSRAHLSLRLQPRPQEYILHGLCSLYFSRHTQSAYF